jgi:hypothetical protein
LEGFDVTNNAGGADPAFTTNMEALFMKTFKLALAGLAALGAAVVAGPEPAKAGGFGISFGFGHPGYHGYGYRPVSYGGWGGYGYHRPYVRKVVVVHRPYYPAYYHRPYRVRHVSYGYPRHYGYYRPHRVRYVSYGYPRHYGYRHHHRRWW